MAVLESFDQVDTSAADELTQINKERKVLQEWLGKVEERRGKVSEEVCERVRRDYEAQLGALEEQSLNPQLQTRVEYLKLNKLYDEFQAALEAVRLDKEELELRHEIGEFEPHEYERRLSECCKLLEQRQAEIAVGDELKGKFLAAFPSDKDLLARPTATAETAPPGPAGGVEDRAKVALEEVSQIPGGATVQLPRAGLRDAAALNPPRAARAAPGDDAMPGGGEAPPESLEASQPVAAATVLLPKEGLEMFLAAQKAAAAHAAAKGEPAPAVPLAGPPGGATVILRRAKLVVVSGEQADKEYPLGLEGTALGSSSDCDVVVPGEAVLASHVELSFGVEGYTLRDLDSTSGTFVNGERVQETLVKDGDRIRVGELEFVFRQA